jgi:hypothetical protein
VTEKQQWQHLYMLLKLAEMGAYNRTLKSQRSIWPRSWVFLSNRLALPDRVGALQLDSAQSDAGRQLNQD